MFRIVYLVLTAFAVISFAEKLETAPLAGERIVGGSDASIYDFPHQISIHDNGRYRCGGSIYSENIVITAAHCVYATDVSRITIVAGSSLLTERSIEIAAEKITVHPKYNTVNYDYDVAIVVLSAPLQFDAGVQPIALATDRSEEGTIVTAIGWGTLEEGGAISNQLQKVDVNVVSDVECKEIYSVTDRMLCAAVAGGGKDACQGDSGGPLIVNNQLLGIISWGYGCARPHLPGVYASVPDLHDWIVETAQQNNISIA